MRLKHCITVILYRKKNTDFLSSTWDQNLFRQCALIAGGAFAGVSELSTGGEGQHSFLEGMAVILPRLRAVAGRNGRLPRMLYDIVA